MSTSSSNSACVLTHQMLDSSIFGFKHGYTDVICKNPWDASLAEKEYGYQAVKVIFQKKLKKKI